MAKIPFVSKAYLKMSSNRRHKRRHPEDHSREDVYIAINARSLDYFKAMQCRPKCIIHL